MRRSRAWIAGVTLVVVALVTTRGRLAGIGAKVDFNRDVRPILNKNCIGCHGGVRQQGELSLLFRDDAMKPAKSGKRALVPGKPGASEMIARITAADPHDRMPKGRDALTAAEISTLRRWVAQGAEWAPHWAYVAPEAKPLPPVSDSAWTRNGIDRWVMARLDREQLRPSPSADCATLARRVSLDLIGLPPTLQQVAASCAGGARGYAQLVDTLLASPRFGERWAAMWLDLARYADSRGFEADRARPMWPYRDWVIDAFNRDLPFDQFTIEQLAGDLLPAPTEAQRIATAFHRNTMTNDEGGTDDEEYRLASVIDRVNTTWTVWQGTSIGCTQCHGHPYDPIRHDEYYRALAILNNSADWDQPDEYPQWPIFAPEKAARGRELASAIERLRNEIDSVAMLPAQEAARRAWEKELTIPAVAGKVNGTWLNEVRRIVKIPEASRDTGQRALLRYAYTQVAEDTAYASRRAKRDTLRRAIDSLAPTYIPVMQELPSTRHRTTRVFDRGNFLVQTKVVAPGLPAAIPPALPANAANRLGLARALVAPDNPLTARVTVNRFWEQLFGTGIVETVEDFGTQGMPPSHPELLDWLAVRFRTDLHWSMKALLKEMVLSATYRQSSAASRTLQERDPANRLLARGPRFRLTAEQLRDQALASAGLLSAKMHGPSVMPPQPEGVWHRPYSGEKWVADTGENGHRRGVYTLWKRTAPYPSMVTFGTPSHEVSVARRTRTNTPLQALVLLNDPVYTEAAQALARRMLPLADTLPTPARLDAALTYGYQLALQRAPSPKVLASLRTLYATAAKHYEAHPDDRAPATGVPTAGTALAALTVVANGIMNLDAFVTKE